MIIRTIKPEDYFEVGNLIKTAFSQTSHGYDGEDELVEEIRKDPLYDPELEMVVERNNAIIGHGLMSRVDVDGTVGLALAPLSVFPEYQRQSVGRKLVAKLEEKAVQRGYTFSTVLGWPEYYQRFSYVKAANHNIKAPFSVPEEYYMVKELVPGGLDNVTGTVHYLQAFGA